MKTITAKSQKREQAAAQAQTPKLPAAPRIKVGEDEGTKQPKQASAAELRRAAETLRGLGDAAGAKRLEDQAAAMKGPAREPKAKSEPRPVCSAMKKDGTKCTAKAKDGQMTCVDHTPAWDRMGAVEQGHFTTWFKEQTAQTIANFIGWHEAKVILKETMGS